MVNVGSQQTVVSGVNAYVLLGGAVLATTTTNGTSTSGQKILAVSTTTGFTAGGMVVVNPGGGDQEVCIIATIQSGVSLTMVANLQQNHAGSETVNQVGNFYAIAKTFTAKWGNNLEEEKVIGNDIQIINTAEYHGEIDLDIGYSTENTAANEQFRALLTPSSGQIPAISMAWTAKDVSGNERTFTLYGTVWPANTEWSLNGPTMSRAKVHCILTARPTLL